MPELSRLEESVLKQAHKRGKLRVEQAKKEEESRYQQESSALKEAFDIEEEHSLLRLKDDYSRKIQNVNNRRRQSSLISKQKLIIAMFDQAVDTMNDWPKEKHVAFIYQVLELYQENYLRIQFGEHTHRHLNSDDFVALKEKFPRIKINEQPIDSKGGFIITIGRVDYNYIYEKLVEATRHDLSSEISQRIFKEE